MLLLRIPAALVSLRSLQRRHKRVGDRRVVSRSRCDGGETLEGHAEAELEGSALERVRRVGVGSDASSPEKARGRSEESGCDVEGCGLAVVATRRF